MYQTAFDLPLIIDRLMFINGFMPFFFQIVNFGFIGLKVFTANVFQQCRNEVFTPSVF